MDCNWALEQRIIVENEAILSVIEIKLLELHNFVEFWLALVSDVDGHPVPAVGEIHSSIESIMAASASAYLYLAVIAVILHTQYAANGCSYFSCSISPSLVELQTCVKYKFIAELARLCDKSSLLCGDDCALANEDRSALLWEVGECPIS